MKRRGAISVSTNTLIVLIISVLVLGLIIALVVGWFNDADDRLAFDEPPPPLTSSQEPVTLSRTQITADPTETLTLRVRVLNTQTSDYEVMPTISCSDEGIVEGVVFNSETVGARESFEAPILFTISNTAPPGTYLCNVAVDSVGREDFRLNIR